MSFYSNYVKKLSVLDMRVAEQKRWIESFPEPRDDIERAYFHFKCRFYGVPRIRIAFLNLLGCFLCWYYLLRFALRRNRPVEREEYDAVLINPQSMRTPYSDKIPAELLEEFPRFFPIDFKGYPDREGGAVDGETARFWLRLMLRHPLEGYFNLNCLLHLGSVYQILRRYCPKAVMSYRTESNFTSSVVTDYCERRGIEHICYMHGDYVCSKDRAFVRFSRMYIWDELYKEIFLWSRCPEAQLRIYRPGMYSLPESRIHEPRYFLTYYCDGDFDKKTLAIRERLIGFVRSGRRCKIRPHPRFSDPEFLRREFEPCGIEIEDCRNVPLQDSVADSEYIVSMRSTVLMQAYYAGKTIVVDNISNPELFEELAEMKAIFIGKPHRLLSKLE